MVKAIFVNLPVKDLVKTTQFWIKLGFSFNPQFTDQNAAALILGENIFAMLMLPQFMTRFTKKQVVDATKATETINALQLPSKAEVDKVIVNAVAAGGKETRPTEDYGWMYGRSFEDLDGHQWEVVHMDLTKAPKNPGEGPTVPEFKEAK